ncbi:MAG: carbamoyltransferase HypF [Synergistales bacterium]|nr:carbamoyltransferase HypF [Synergistales bacterium]
MVSQFKLLVTGIVQGVGFRPFCARLAKRLDLSGSVQNTSEGVRITLEGPAHLIESYMELLSREHPPLAVVSDIQVESVGQVRAPSGSFTIEKSLTQRRQRVLIPPDVATCPECLEEVRTPGERRYRYPFTNCTNCGPRYSIIERLPYDRPFTTMHSFAMCDACQKEYEDPFDRRYHAQPIACPLCGPQLEFITARESADASWYGEEALQKAVESLQGGEIVAIKGLGGYHLACDAFNETSVSRLRERKMRPMKPFAVMVADREQAERLLVLSEESMDFLQSPRAPICIGKTRRPCLAPSVAPGQNSIGVMLPYTPLHWLLMEHFEVLVMTSANLSDEPLIADDREALEKLGGIADAFLRHNRPIFRRIDDSVAIDASEGPIMVRRARGFVPSPLFVPQELPELLAAGAEMKSTFALTQGRCIFPSQYLGDLKDIATVGLYKEALRHYRFLFRIDPAFLVCDMHPQFLSTATAREETEGRLEELAVQHHHAHLAACLAEHEKDGPAIGLILDGTGYGADGTIWGGELLVGDVDGYRREGHLAPFRLVGGDRAVAEPWRSALSLLVEALGWDGARSIAKELWPQRTETVEQLFDAYHLFPVTTSCGRLFDGVAALLGCCATVSFDGEAPMLLEGAVDESCDAIMPFLVYHDSEGLISLDWKPAVRWLVSHRNDTLSRSAAAFHRGLAAALVQAVALLHCRCGLSTVVLSGGVWQNRLLSDEVAEGIREKGWTPLLHKRLPPNDECVAVGQAVIGARYLEKKGAYA